MIKLRRIRIEQGYDQRTLAATLYVTAACISHWERGKTHPRPRVRKRLSKVLAHPADDLFEPDE